MSEYKEVQIGPKTVEIPEKWEVSNLSGISKINMGQSPPGSSYNENGIGLPFFQGNGEFGDISPTVKKWTTEPKKAAEKNEILISVRAPVGELNIAPYKCCIGRGLASIKSKENSCDKFIFYLLLQTRNQLKSFSQGSTFNSINKDVLSNFEIPLPPLPEQRRIAEILSTVDDAIQKTDEVIEKAERLKKGLMQDLLTKGIGHNEFKEVQIGPKTVEIPEEWGVETLGKEDGLCKVVAGGTPSTKVDEYWGGNISWVTPTDITNNGNIYISDSERKITEKGLNKSSATLLPEGSILLTTRATIGEASINTVPMATNQGFKSLICKEKADNEFIYYMVQFQKRRLSSLGGGSTFDEVSKKDVTGFEILSPPLEEQQKIAKILTTLDDKIRKEEKNKRKLNHLKKGLMQDLLTGKVRVNI